MSVLRRYHLLTYALCVSLAVLMVSVVHGSLGFDGPLLDVLVAARALVLPEAIPPARAPVVVIALDQRSLEAPELAPYPSAFLAPVWATVLDGVFTAGARAVGFDRVFAYSANRFAADFDRPLLETLGKYRDRVVLGRSATTLPAWPLLAALRNDAESLGLLELPPADMDGRYRRLWASHATTSDGRVPGLASALLRRAQAPAMPAVLLLAPRHPLEQLPTYAVIDVLRCARQSPEAMHEAFAGAIVVIGSISVEEDRKGTSDRWLPRQRAAAPSQQACGLRRLGASAPDASTVPGVFLHAAAVEAVLHGRLTATAPPPVVALLTAAMAVVGAALGLTLTPWWTVLATAGLAVLLGATATGLLAGDVWLPLALPLGALVLAPGIAYVARYLCEERTRRQIERAFCHYLSPAIVTRLAQHPAALHLGGEQREVTVMFADLSGFTALSGKVNAEVLMRTTNQYLSYIVEQVEATGGYVDKFIGDAVMALWGAPVDDPQHAVHAIQAAMAAADRILQQWQAATAQGEPGFAVKIGLNSGPAMVGNVGTERRYNYTAVGETVNVAARLESIPSLYACQIVVGPCTAALAQDDCLLCELDTIQVKGRETPLAIFEPLAPCRTATGAQHAYTARFAQALAHYRARDFTAAAALWEALAVARHSTFPTSTTAPGAIANPATTMAARAREYARHPPACPWRGVWVLTSK
jgi:adenylate cyclase